MADKVHKWQLRCGSQEWKDVGSDQLILQVSEGHLPFYSEILSDGNWINLSDHKIAEAIAAMAKKDHNTWNEKSLFGHWYVNSDDYHFGPFSMVQMIELYQQNNLNHDSLIRRPGMKEWKAFTAVQPFDDRSIKSLFNYPGLKQAFTQRKSPRVQYDNEVCVSVAGHLYEGMSLSLSKKGIGIKVNEVTQMRVKDQLSLIINPNSEHGTIQSKCEVVSMNRVDGKDRIGLVFAQEIEPLTEYIERRVPFF